MQFHYMYMSTRNAYNTKIQNLQTSHVPQTTVARNILPTFFYNLENKPDL